MFGMYFKLDYYIRISATNIIMVHK